MAQKRVRYFDVTSLVPGSTIIIIGKRSSGKSVLQYDLMSRMKGWFSFGLALTPTQSSVEQLCQCMPRSFIAEQSPERLGIFLRMIKRLADKATREGREPRGSFLFCDDTAFDDKFMRCKALSEVFLNGRHSGVTVCLTLQYVMKIAPDTRSNADYVFVAYTNNMGDRKKIREAWFAMLTPKEFDELFDEATKNYGVLVLDSRASATSRDWRNCIFWYSE